METVSHGAFILDLTVLRECYTEDIDIYHEGQYSGEWVSVFRENFRGPGASTGPGVKDGKIVMEKKGEGLFAVFACSPTGTRINSV